MTGTTQNPSKLTKSTKLIALPFPHLRRCPPLPLLSVCVSISFVLSIDARSAVRPSYRGWVRGVPRGPYRREQDKDHPLEGEARRQHACEKGVKEAAETAENGAVQVEFAYV